MYKYLLVILLLTFSSCYDLNLLTYDGQTDQQNFIDIHKAARGATSHKTCYDITAKVKSLEELNGHYCLEYIPNVKKEK